MNSLIWFIDARLSVSDSVMSKVVFLSSSFHKPVNIIIDIRDRGIERWYWPNWGEKQRLAADIDAKNDLVKQQICKKLSRMKLEYNIVYTHSDDYLSTICTSLGAASSTLLILEDQLRAQRHPIFQVFQKIPSPILLLTKKPWSKPLNTLAAVDPLHEHARADDLDRRIVLMAKLWSKYFAVKWKVVHCCYVPPVIIKHSKMITAMHAEGLADFADKLIIPKDKTILLQGNPEYALPKLINKNDTNLLILGLVARNRLEQFFVGSTTSALLDEPPCDMLLLPDKTSGTIP